jgi:hypothetical protein
MAASLRDVDDEGAAPSRRFRRALSCPCNEPRVAFLLSCRHLLSRSSAAQLAVHFDPLDWIDLIWAFLAGACIGTVAFALVS